MIHHLGSAAAFREALLRAALMTTLMLAGAFVVVTRGCAPRIHPSLTHIAR